MRLLHLNVAKADFASNPTHFYREYPELPWALYPGKRR